MKRCLVELRPDKKEGWNLVGLDRDVADSDYKILLGRNWLAGRYIVDVDKKQD